MILTISDYDTLEVDNQTEFKLLFQSKFKPDDDALSAAYHLVTVKVTKIVRTIKEYPYFTEPILPISIVADFKNRATKVFNRTEVVFPHILDPNNNELIPMKFLKIEEYEFLSYDRNQTLTIDPNLINDTLVEKRKLDMQVVISNKLGVSSTV